jgi:hypothetical protein
LTTTESHGWWKNDRGNGKITLTLYIQPNARHTAVAGRHGDALKLRIAAPAVDDKANWALINFLHQCLISRPRKSASARVRADVARLSNLLVATPHS